MIFDEAKFKGWCLPPSPTEQEKINNAINMIKSAIAGSQELQDLDIEIFAQGSFANNTNVKASSDVDVCIMLKSTFFTKYPPGQCDSDYGFIEGTITYNDYKSRVLNALIKKFGSSNVHLGDKSIKIRSNSYHVEADAVVAFMLKDYYLINSKQADKYIEGIRFISNSGVTVSNYPKDHIANGTQKNNTTNYAYKKLVRIFKRLRNEMIDAGLVDDDKITSFLIECLVWNVPNNIITGYSTWTETVRQSITYLYNAINENRHLEWGEVSEHLYLFKARKWTDEDAKSFLLNLWNYAGC